MNPEETLEAKIQSEGLSYTARENPELFKKMKDPELTKCLDAYLNAYSDLESCLRDDHGLDLEA